jgi:hypothetical protein
MAVGITMSLLLINSVNSRSVTEINYYIAGTIRFTNRMLFGSFNAGGTLKGSIINFLRPATDYKLQTRSTELLPHRSLRSGPI